MICNRYKLDATFKEKDALMGRIEKTNLLVLDKKPDVVIDQNHESPVPKINVPAKINDSKSNHKKPQTKPKVDENKSNHRKPKTDPRIVFNLKKLLSKLTQ